LNEIVGYWQIGGGTTAEDDSNTEYTTVDCVQNPGLA